MELIKSNSRFYYDGELRPGILLKDSGENEIKVSKFNAVKIGDRHFLLDPNVSAETFLNLQIRNGRHEYLYKSGDKIIVRDEDGNEIMPVEWIEKGMKVITAEGTGTVETFTDNIALIKSRDGLKNHYIKNLSFADTTSDFQKYRQGWQVYEKILPQIQQEIKLDNTRLLKGAFMDAFNKLDASMPKKNAPAAEPTNIETPKIEPVKVAKEDATPKVSLVSKIKNAFKKPQNVPEVATPPPTVNANHDLATPPPPQTTLKSSKPEHLGKEYTHVDESNRAGQDNHVLAHISLNPDSTNDKDKYLYHYEVGAHRDPITVNKFLNSSGDSKDEHGADITPPAFITNGVYIPGEEVINKTNGERNTVVSHIDFNKGTGALNPNNILVKDASGQTKSIPRGDVKLSSHDRTTHSVVNTDNGNKHLHDLQEGDVINHEGNKHSVLYSDPKKGLATVNQATGQMHFVSANNYHKPYLGEVKPEVKEGQQVQIGKKRFKVEHVSGEEEKGTTILSHTNKLGEKEYYEHPTNKLFDKILKPADLQEYQGDRFSPKAKPKTEESDPQKYPHADMHDIDSAQEIMELKSKHPNLTEDDIDFLKTGRGLNLKDINGMSQDEVHTILSKQPGYKAPVPDSNPMPETPLPQPVQEQKQKSRLDQIAELHDNAFGEHNKTVNKDSVTHRVGIGDLAVKAGAGGTEILNKEVPIGKKKTAIIHDIDPVGKKITFRMKKDDPEDKSKYKTRSIDNFKTYVQENEELDPRADTDVRSRQVAHENDFQNKVYERVAKHLHEKGLAPTKENIENELKTSNTGLRQSLEQYHKTYEANHNKEKAKGSIVDHPDYEKLDMDKTLSRVPNIEEKVKGELAKIKGSREEQRKKIKESLVDDIAKEYLKNGREYDEKPEVEPTQEDFDMHRKLGGTDQEVHEGVKQRMAELKGQQEYENKVKNQKAGYKQAAQEAADALKEKENQTSEDYLNKHYRSKPDIASQSINNQLGLKPSEREFDVPDNEEHDKSKFEDHIVPLSSLTASHIPTQGQKNQEAGAEKAPMTPNPAHPSRLQGRQTYHDESDAGSQDRKYTMNVGSDIRPKKLTGEGTEIDTGAPIVENKGMAINNGRIIGMQTATPESKEKYVTELKKTAKQLFPDANEEELHKKFQELLDKGDMPVHVRVPRHSSGDYLSYDKHPDETSSLASASNNPGIKSSLTQDKIQSALNSLNDETKIKILKEIPPNITLRQHIQDTGNAKKMLQHYKLDPQVQKLFFGKDGRINDDGKDFLVDSTKHLNLDKELKELSDGNGKLGKKFDDFHNANFEILGDIRSNNKDYDLIPHIKDALRETVSDKKQLQGQQKMIEESPITKGLRYLINSPEKNGHKKINNFGLNKELNEVANSVAEAHHQVGKDFEGNTKIGRQIPDKNAKGSMKEDEDEANANKAAVNKYVKDGGDIVKFNSTVSQKLKELQHYHTHQTEATGALKRYRDATKNVTDEIGTDDNFGDLGFEKPKDLSTPQQTKEKFFKKYADLYDRQQKNQPKESESKPDIHPAGELIKELQNDDKSVSVENEKPDNSIENKEDNISSEKSVDPSLESSKAYIDDKIKATNDSLEKGHFNPRDSSKLTFKLDKEGNIKDVGHHVNKNDNETVVAEDHPDATWKSSEHSDLYTERHGKEIKAQHKSLTDSKALLESDLPGKLLSAAKKVGGLKQLGKELNKHGFDKVGNPLTLSDSSKPSLHNYILNHSDKADSIKDALKEIDGGSNKDNSSSEKSVGDINNLPDGRFEVSEPDGGKANFTDESKAKEYSKILKNEEELNKPKEVEQPKEQTLEELKNKFEQDEPNVIYDSKNDLSNHPEAKRYENFPDKKVVTWGQGNYKGIHPDNIMHFNQGGANSRYGRVSFIAPSEHKFKKHAQYKKLAKEMRQEGKDVIINAFKNPNIVAKINKMGGSVEPKEQPPVKEKKPFVSEHTEPEMQDTASSVHNQLDNHMDSLEPEHHESLKKDLGEDYRKKMPDVISSYIHKGVDALKKYGEKTKEAIKNITKKILIGSAIMLSLHGGLSSNQVGATVTPPTNQAIEQAASNETSIPKELNSLSDYGKNIYKYQKGQGKSFAILDKDNAQIHLIDKNGNYLKTLPTVTGIEKGDHWNTSDPDKPTPKGGSTPYGEYSMELDKDSAFRLAEKVKTEDGRTLKMYNNLAIHKVFEGDAARRYKALTTEDPNDNRMSWGCINIAKNEMRNTIYPNFNNESILYVLPEKDTNVNAPSYKNNKEIRNKIIKENNVRTEYEKSYWDELRKSFEDPEPSNRSPYPMTLESENVMPKLSNTASGQQHLATLKNNGVPEEELHTTGLHNLLNTDKKIPKTDIQDHLRHNIGKWNKENVEDPQHEQYSLPGGHTNYREVLHTYTEPDVDAKEFHRKELNKKIEEHYNPSQYHLERYLTPEEKITHKDALEPVGNKPREQWEWALDEAQRIVRSRMDKEIEDYSKTHNIKLTNNPDIRGGSRYDYVLPNKPQTWNQGHYIPNNGNSEVIYHQRFNNRQTPEGKKVTHMEEQQSDIHQAGREVGYDNEETQNKRKELSEHLVKEQEKINAHPDIQRLYKMDNVKLHEEDIKDLRELAKKYNHNLDEQGLDIFGKITGRDYDDLEERIRNKISPDFESKLKETQGEPVPDVPLKGNKWKEHGFKQALMEAVKDNSDYLSWTTGDQQFKRWGSINVNWQPHKSKEGWNVNIKGRHDDSDLSKDYHVNSLEDVKKLPGEAGSKWSEKIWDRIQKQPEGADYEPLRHGMNKEYSEVLPNIAKKHLKKFGIHPEDIELKGAGKQIYQGKEHLHSEISDVIKEIENSDRYSGYVKKLLTNTAKDLQSKRMYNQSERPFADAVEEMLESNDAPDGRVDEIIKMLHPNNRIINGSSTKVHAVKITPELREHILKNGFSMYKSFDEFNEPLQKSLQKPEVPPHDRDETFHLYGNQFMVGNIYHGIKNGTIPHEIQTVKTFNPQDHGIKIYPDIIKENENNPIDNTKPTGLWLKFNYKGEPHNFPIDGSHRMHQLHKNGEPTTNVIVVKDVDAIKKHSDLLMNQKHITPWEDNKLQKSNINYPERIHAMRNRRGENISSIAVMNGDKILMGRRRDSDKWTLPGGHAEEGETAEETGIRELEEETGIKAKKLESLGSEQVKNPNAPELMINCFKYETDESTSMRDDPDTEVKKWVWVSTPISQDILDNLHAKKNVTLKLLGLQNWEKSFVYQMKTAFNNLIKLLS